MQNNKLFLAFQIEYMLYKRVQCPKRSGNGTYNDSYMN